MGVFVSAPSLHRESTDSLIRAQKCGINIYVQLETSLIRVKACTSRCDTTDHCYSRFMNVCPEQISHLGSKSTWLEKMKEY